ncbi:MAG: M48 family metalloprotease [Promethearchaeota archaeon]|nr:MAG: M48 family metalloprotease [Candidatus Lokiarchaeota archaeon]
MGIFLLLNLLIFKFSLLALLTDWTFLITLLLYLLSIEEFYHWAKNGKRSELSDIVAIFFFFFIIFFFSKEFLTSIMGAFSIYLWIGIFELRDYPVINKILIISLVTYNVIFIAGLFSYYLGNPFYINTSFAFSFWIILILGFLLFGRKYIVVWRFMSPEYLTLFLYIIAWLAVVFINQYTPITFILTSPFGSDEFNFINFFMNIYVLLIVVNWVIYFLSGFILDKLLGIHKVKDEKLLKIVDKIKIDIGIKSKVKVGYGKYPILNAMAYGSIFDKRITIIAPDIKEIPKDELKGILAHELAHTKGKHTLILTLITSTDLIIRMFFGIPATLYDYTFGNPQIPMIYFIFLNLGIYAILFIFVRILEGKADLITKKSGYANELVKALYNLESFYSTGREVGFNTMLLCEEKITNDNKLLDYMNTAKYLYSSMIKSSRVSLLANLINSHPPSFYRIAAILSNDLKPSKEAVLPFICLKKSKQKKYGQKFKEARDNFKIIANQKFKELFKINDIPSLMMHLKRKELYTFDIQKDYIFRNLITDEISIGKLEDVQFIDDITDSDQLIIQDLKTNQKEILNSTLYSRKQFQLHVSYFFSKDDKLTLDEIKLNNNNKDGHYVFSDKNNKKIQKVISKTKLPNSVSVIKDLKNKDIFLKTKGELKVVKCTAIIPNDKLDDFQIKLSAFETLGEKSTNYFLNNLIIRPKKIYLNLSRSSIFRKSEIDVITWIIKKKLLTYIFLKKPVNNIEIGYIKEIIQEKNKTNISQNDNMTVNVVNIFDKEKSIPFKEIETISFEYDSAIVQIKSETSLTSRLGYKILRKIKPERIIIT